MVKNLPSTEITATDEASPTTDRRAIEGNVTL
jgi:hypothetical protein